MIVKSVPEELIDRSRQFIGNNVKVVVELFSPKLKLHNMSNKTTRKQANP
jgi:hypothetical protein